MCEIIRSFQSLCADTETDGLDFRKDKLRLVQLCTSQNRVYFIREPSENSPNLRNILADPTKTFVFHSADFDIKTIKAWMAVSITGNIECTKTLMKIVSQSRSQGCIFNMFFWKFFILPFCMINIFCNDYT